MDLGVRSGQVKFFIGDRDSKFTAEFDQVLASSGVRVIKTPVRSPGANSFAERQGRNTTARAPRPPADLRRTAPPVDSDRIRAALQRASAAPVAAATTSAARARPSGRCHRPDQAQADRPWPD